MSTTIQIPTGSSLKDLKQCNPYLMPFHINYTGPAPISTYLKVEPASDVVGGPQQPNSNNASRYFASESTTEPTAATSDSQETLLDSSESVAQNGNDTQTASASTSTIAEQEPGTAKKSGPGTRFISSFRGRTIQGLNVDIPEGYVGVILEHVGDNGTTGGSKGGVQPSVAAAKAQAKAEKEARKAMKAAGKAGRGRGTRSKSRAIAVEDDAEGDGDEDIVMLGATIPDTERDADMDRNLAVDGQENGRTMMCASQFSSFVLWHPDIPVDERRDDYYRALTEWTYLASEVIPNFMIF
ncbi:hypothetical protein AX16_009263 [Volvariella volvacea WC 439]|nr:hypothetical protein AX16_009263 [Volvariella volvacea WC 439]